MADNAKQMPWEEEREPCNFEAQEFSPKKLAISALYADLLVVAVEIGGICDMAHWAGAGVAGRIYATGKSLDELSVGQLIAILKQQERDHALIEERAALGGGSGNGVCDTKELEA